MAAKSTDETVTSPGDVVNVFASGISDDDDAELAKLHGDDDEEDEVNNYRLLLYCASDSRLPEKNSSV